MEFKLPTPEQFRSTIKFYSKYGKDELFLNLFYRKKRARMERYSDEFFAAFLEVLHRNEPKNILAPILPSFAQLGGVDYLINSAIDHNLFRVRSVAEVSLLPYRVDIAAIYRGKISLFQGHLWTSLIKERPIVMNLLGLDSLLSFLILDERFGLDGYKKNIGPRKEKFYHGKKEDPFFYVQERTLDKKGDVIDSETTIWRLITSFNFKSTEDPEMQREYWIYGINVNREKKSKKAQEEKIYVPNSTNTGLATF